MPVETVMLQILEALYQRLVQTKPGEQDFQVPLRSGRGI